MLDVICCIRWNVSTLDGLFLLASPLSFQKKKIPTCRQEEPTITLWNTWPAKISTAQTNEQVLQKKDLVAVFFFFFFFPILFTKLICSCNYFLLMSPSTWPKCFFNLPRRRAELERRKSKISGWRPSHFHPTARAPVRIASRVLLPISQLPPSSSAGSSSFTRRTTSTK